jgi:modulator of FtsH protease HflK
MKRWVGPAMAFALLAYMATGLVVVAQDESGVVRRFGAVMAEPWGPGLHWGMPWGIDQVDRINTGQTRTLAVGARGLQVAPLSRSPDPSGDDFLTGDLNLATLEAIVQYRVADPVRFLFGAQSVKSSLAAAAESALMRAMAERGIDDVLTSGRAEVAERVGKALQEEVEHQRLGISIRAVRLGRVVPPAAVAPAFVDADRARSDRRRAVVGAEEYRDRAIADAQGRAIEIADGAAAELDRRVQLARGEAERFTKVLAEARKDPGATRRRLYLEALAELLPRFRRKVVVEPGQDLDLSLFADEASAPAEEPRP